MRVFIAACAAAVLIATLGAIVLSYYQKPVDVAFATESVRI